MKTQQIMAMLHRKKPTHMDTNETTETNDQNPWRPLEPGENAKPGDRKVVYYDGHFYSDPIWETRRPRPAPSTCSTPDTTEPGEGAGGGDNTQAKRYLCERCDAKDAYLSLIGETKKAGGGAVCLHGIRHPWECKACADAAWDLHKRASEAGGGDQHAWRCTRCGETDVPPSHVTYQETHDGGCGGACVVEPVNGGGDQRIANLEAELLRVKDAARKEILGEQGKRLAALVERDDARAGWQEAEKALTAWMEKLNGQIGLRMAVEAELAQARQRIAELEKGIAEIKAGTRIGWLMTDLGAKCSKLLNP